MAEATSQFSIGEEIVFEILKHFPSKSLLRFRCVSKDWSRLIDDPYFIHSHRICSHTRPGGIQLLTSYIRFDNYVIGFSPYYMQDPEGNSRTGLFSFPSGFLPYLVSNVEGLICFGTYPGLFKEPSIWNPSTRETMNLPQLFDDNCSIMSYKDYRLGFDSFTNKYKVVCFCNTFRKQVPEVQEVYVLTLGDNSWKRIPFIPQESIDDDGFSIIVSESFGNMIFCVIRGTTNQKARVLMFDVQHEQLGFISFPYELWPYNHTLYAAEIDGLFAFKERDTRTMWVLDHGNIPRWTKMEITIDGCLDTYVFQEDGYEMRDLIPVGTFDTDEILFRCIGYNRTSEKTLVKHFYYDQETKKIRFVPKLDENSATEVGSNIMIKHVDNIVSLKPTKKLGWSR